MTEDMDMFIGNFFSILSLAWKMSFFQSAYAQGCQNWCASNAQQWEVKCKWQKTCGGCAKCTSGMTTVLYPWNAKAYGFINDT